MAFDLVCLGYSRPGLLNIDLMTPGQSDRQLQNMFLNYMFRIFCVLSKNALGVLLRILPVNIVDLMAWCCRILVLLTRDYSVHAPSQWETTLHCNVVSHWLGAYTNWSLLTKVYCLSYDLKLSLSDLKLQGPFWNGLTLMTAWISNPIHYKVWDEITHSLPNFNSATIELWELMSKFILYFTGHVNTYPCWYSETCIKWQLNIVVSQDRWSFTTGRINIILCPSQTNDEIYVF